MKETKVEDLREMAVEAAQKVDEFFKRDEDCFEFSLTGVSFDFDMCDDPEDDESPEITLSFSWRDEMTTASQGLDHGRALLLPKQFVSSDFVAGMLVAAIYELENTSTVCEEKSNEA